MKRHASMNRIYRLVWNQSLNVWVAVAENAKGRGKSISASKLVAAALALTSSLLLAPLAQAGPTGGQISTGTGSIAQSGATTTINQSSQNIAINWQSFGIAANETVRFNQPNATAIALNRVLGQDPSQILGSLSANGQVFILNPNGVLFGSGSQVNVGGLVATSLSLSDADFLAGKYTFTNNGAAGSVVNQGDLTAAQSGYIAMLAPEVRNEGVISATLGTALLAAGNKVTINLNNGSLLSYSIDQGALNALAENKQLIQADGGQVFMSAKAADALSTAVVNNTGVIEARTIQNVGGVIKLMGDMEFGTVNVGGTLDASAPDGGNGGFVETSAAHVNITNDAKVTTLAPVGENGTWLIDPPVDFTIAASGGNMTGALLATSLAAGNVTILSTNLLVAGAGNINVNDVVAWSANKLTLNAQNDIYINANLNASGTGSLALEYGQGALAAGNTSTYSLSNGAQVNLPAGPNFRTKQGSDGAVKPYTVITLLGTAGSLYSHTDLQGMGGGYDNYALGGNIDASATSSWNSGAGFFPIIGYGGGSFPGSFDGLGHTISNLYINRPSNNYQGLFGYISLANGASVTNLGLINVNITGLFATGGLAGAVFYDGDTTGRGWINNVYVTGSITGHSNHTGGLVGTGTGVLINNSYSTATITGAGYTGGLIGTSSTWSAGYQAVISNSYATGSVTGGSIVGGLVGYAHGYNTTISSSYATGNVNGLSYLVGGLLGYLSGGGVISNSYATGNVTGNDKIGGLIGTINSYGDVGYRSISISNSYATGTVTGTTNVGGFSGYAYPLYFTIDNSFYNKTVNPLLTGVGAVYNAGGDVAGVDAAGSVFGMSTTDMKVQANFTSATTANGSWNPGWDFTNAWKISAGQNSGYPALKWQIPSYTIITYTLPTIDAITYNGADRLLDGLFTLTFGGTTNTLIAGADYDFIYSENTVTGFKNVGTYSGISISLLNAAYQLAGTGNTNGSLTINPYAVSLTGSRAYDGMVDVAASALSTGNLVGSETLMLNGTGTMADKYIGTNKILSLGTLALADGTGLASNYTFNNGTHTATITAAQTATIDQAFDAKNAAVAFLSTGLPNSQAFSKFDGETDPSGQSERVSINNGSEKTARLGFVAVKNGGIKLPAEKDMMTSEKTKRFSDQEEEK